MWLLFFFKRKAAYELRISDWSSDVCSSDLRQRQRAQQQRLDVRLLAGFRLDVQQDRQFRHVMPSSTGSDVRTASQSAGERAVFVPPDGHSYRHDLRHPRPAGRGGIVFRCPKPPGGPACFFPSNALTGPETQVTVRKPQALLLSLAVARSEEHTSELQSL